jgi:hypothetical protein
MKTLLLGTVSWKRILWWSPDVLLAFTILAAVYLFRSGFWR